MKSKMPKRLEKIGNALELFGGILLVSTGVLIVLFLMTTLDSSQPLSIYEILSAVIDLVISGAFRYAQLWAGAQLFFGLGELITLQEEANACSGGPAAEPLTDGPEAASGPEQN